MRTAVFLLLTVAAAGCGMSDQDIRQKTGDAAVAVKHAAESASDKLKGAYDDAAAKGKIAIKDAGERLGDEALKAKIIAGFGLVAGLDAKNVNIDVKQGKVYLSGTVPTQLDKSKAEGVAYGVTGDTSKYESTIEVKGP